MFQFSDEEIGKSCKKLSIESKQAIRLNGLIDSMNKLFAENGLPCKVIELPVDKPSVVTKYIYAYWHEATANWYLTEHLEKFITDDITVKFHRLDFTKQEYAI